MGKLVSTIIEVGTLGLVQDPLGIEAGEEAIAAGTAAQLEAGQAAIASREEGLAITRADLAPFREAGVTALPTLTSAIDDPSARVLSNPFFQALAGQQEERLLASQAARGKVGSGGTEDALQRNLLLLGNQFAQQDISNIRNLTSAGQSAAAGQGAAQTQAARDTANILIQGGNVQAAGGIAQANVEAQATRDVVGGGAAAIGAFSDIRLKENIVFSHFEDGIKIFTWDWTKEAKSLVGDQESKGPIAQILRKDRPELVIDDPRTGYLKVAM